jgi:hypothetical protein
MSNLFELRCPACGDENQIDIQATVWLRVTENGTDADASENGDHIFTEKSAACCGACGHCATMRAFEPERAASMQGRG